MALDVPLNLPKDNTKVAFQTLDTFKKGVITLIDESRLPKDALAEADNIFLYEDGMPGTRPGVDWYGVDIGAVIDGANYYEASDGSSHLVVAAGGTIYRSDDDGDTWDTCTGVTYTAGNAVKMNQNGGYLYITNGVDEIIRYDGTTTLLEYTALATPSGQTATQTGMAGSVYTYWYKISAVNEIGVTTASNSATETTNEVRENWSASKYIDVDWGTVTGATRYDVYISDDNQDYYYVGSTVGDETQYKDDGTAVVNPAVLAPTDNTTQGPLVEELVNVGSRQYGVRDSNNKYRIWFSGSGNLSGAFSPSYDGGYVDWQEGGKFIPVQVEDYRDGKGTPYATVWCKSADGQGCVLQVSLDILTVGDISITVPSIYRLPGSRGTPAPGSVVNVLNDYMFYNSQAFYNLGSRAQFLNLLSTDESSSNIRPTVKGISAEGEEMIASVYFDARVYFSVGYGSSTNNHTAVYDTERRAWLPKAFTIGFDGFIRYTENSTGKSRRLLAWKNGDTQLSYIDESINGDYGVSFQTSLLTALLPVSKNRFEFQWTEEGEVEFSNPQGQIFTELVGIERTKGYSTSNNETIQPTFTNTGWDTKAWDLYDWDDTSVVPDTFSESTIKRYFNVQKELNAVQWRITTNAIDARYVLRTLQTWGSPTNAGKPRAWRL